MDLRDQLQRIYDQRGTLTPDVVVEEARDESHALHARFEWDDQVAGEKFRRIQAHELIQSVKITYRDPADHDQEIRAFHAIRRETGYVYEPVDQVVGDELATKILLQEMEREWRRLKKRFDQFEEFRAMIRRDLDAA